MHLTSYNDKINVNQSMKIRTSNKLYKKNLDDVVKVSLQLFSAHIYSCLYKGFMQKSFTK